MHTHPPIPEQPIKFTYRANLPGAKTQTKTGAKRSLTPRQKEIAQLLLHGASTESIAEDLGIGVGTVETHKRSIYIKMNCHSKAELFTAKAARRVSVEVV